MIQKSPPSPTLHVPKWVSYGPEHPKRRNCRSVLLFACVILVCACHLRLARPHRFVLADSIGRRSMLRMYATGSKALADVLEREGEPEFVDAIDIGKGSAEVHLDYARACWIRYFFRVDSNELWEFLQTGRISSLQRYRATDTADAYQEYLQKCPDDPPAEVDFARARIRFLQEKLHREAEEAQARARLEHEIAELERFLRKHPHGHDPAPIYKNLADRSRREARGEFETTEEHQRRLLAEARKPILGSLTTESLMAFETLLPETMYDADRRTMKIGVPRIGETIWLKRTVTNRGSYVASNAFGATTIVERSSDSIYLVWFKNLNEFSVAESYKLAVIIPMDSATALRFKSRLSLVAVSRLAPPFAWETGDYSAPTFHNPSEESTTYYKLQARLIEIWVCDSKTGEVLTRVRADR